MQLNWLMTANNKIAGDIVKATGRADASAVNSIMQSHKIIRTSGGVTSVRTDCNASAAGRVAIGPYGQWGNSRVPLCIVCLSVVATGDRKDFFTVHAHFAFPKEMQNARELQKRFRQRRSLCLHVSIAPTV